MARKKKPAKKSARKPARKASRKPAKKTAGKPARRKSRAPKATGALKMLSMGVKVKTGRGPGPLEIGTDLVSMFNRGQLKEIEDKWWSPKIVSTEGTGVAMEWRGRRAVNTKNSWWTEDHVMHGGSAEGPYVGSTGFAVRYRLDVETKSTGVREVMEEVGVYTVHNGKIVREEFMYSLARPEPAAPAPAPATEDMLAPIGG